MKELRLPDGDPDALTPSVKLIIALTIVAGIGLLWAAQTFYSRAPEPHCEAMYARAANATESLLVDQAKPLRIRGRNTLPESTCGEARRFAAARDSSAAGRRRAADSVEASRAVPEVE